MTYKNKTVQRHKRGNWYARIRFGGKVICVYGRTQAETYAKLKVLCDKVESEKLALSLQRLESVIAQEPVKAESKSQKTYTLQEWFDEWLNSYKVGNVRACTLDCFNRNFRKLKSLYNVKITDITNLMLSKAINDITSNRAKDGVHNLLKQMFATAFNNRLVESNPAANLPRPKQFAKNEKRAFTQEQERQFVDFCLTDINRYAPFLICVLQGLRRGEMLALRLDDCDFEKDTLRIDESYDPKNPDDLLTKNATSNRTMPMFGLTKQVLLKYLYGKPNERIHEQFGTNTLAKRLAKLYKLNPNLPQLTIHELRHTFISRCHEKGIDEMIVQKWVGHAIGSRMTKAIYTHIADDQERKYIEAMNGKMTA